jgi:hypothetical protein
VKQECEDAACSRGRSALGCSRTSGATRSRFERSCRRRPGVPPATGAEILRRVCPTPAAPSSAHSFNLRTVLGADRSGTPACATACAVPPARSVRGRRLRPRPGVASGTRSATDPRTWHPQIPLRTRISYASTALSLKRPDSMRARSTR